MWRWGNIWMLIFGCIFYGGGEHGENAKMCVIVSYCGIWRSVAQSINAFGEGLPGPQY
jgi:hypothetical protein